MVSEMGCSPVSSTGYGEFSRRIHDRLLEKNIPLEGSIEVTERCNLHCAHCFINQAAGDQNARDRELSSDEIVSIIDQAVDEGCLWLLFTGGEPFLRPDFLDIYLHAKRRGLLITLFTNGTLLTPAIADTLAEYPPFSIEISCYGATTETYERVTGVPGSHEQCIRGIELLLSRNLPLKIKSPLMKLNYHEREALQEFAASLGIEFRYDVELNLRTNGDQGPAQQRLEPEQVVQLDFADQRREEEWLEFARKFAGEKIHPDSLFQCGAGSGSFHIDPYGQMTCCLMVREPCHDLRRETFRRGWLDLLPKVVSQKCTGSSVCNGCEHRYLCSWCPGWARMEHGRQEEPVEYLCRITWLRARRLANLVERRSGMNDQNRRTRQ